MDFLTNNLYILIPIIVLFVLAFINGAISKKLLKFLSAYLNLIGLFFLFFGVYIIVSHYFFNKTSEIVQENDKVNEQILTSSYLSTPNFVDANQSIDKAFIFLDFSGSVKTETVLKRIQSFERTFKNVNDTRLFFFGSCTHEIENVSTLTIEDIENIKKESCHNNEEKIKSYTDIVYMLEELDKILQNNANNKTICLFITDDIQSTRTIDSNINERINKLKDIYTNYTDKGVVFQLIKVPGNNNNLVMSSDELNPIFNASELIESVSLEKNIQNILKQRFLSEDFSPIQTKKDKKINNKVTFELLNVIGNKSGLSNLKIKVNNHYKSFSPVIKIDSVVSENWKAINFSEKWGENYIKIEPNAEKNFETPFKYKNNYGLTFFNRTENDKAKVYYQVLIPGSQQIAYESLFTEKSEYKKQTQKPFNGIFAGSFYSSTSVEQQVSIDKWLYFLYAILAFILSFVLRRLIKPTLQGRRITIKNIANNQLLVNKNLKNISTYNWTDENQLMSVNIKSVKVKRRPFNLIRQPNDLYTFKMPDYGVSIKTKKQLSREIADYQITIK